jgi:hypothetical protein
MDPFMEVNKISNEVEEEHYETCLDDGMMESNDEEKNMVLKTLSPKDVLIGE